MSLEESSTGKEERSPVNQSYVLALKSAQGAVGTRSAGKRFQSLISQVCGESRGKASAFFSRELKLHCTSLSDWFYTEDCVRREFLGLYMLDPSVDAETFEYNPFAYLPTDMLDKDQIKIVREAKRWQSGVPTLRDLDPAEPVPPDGTIGVALRDDIWLNDEQRRTLEHTEKYFNGAKVVCQSLVLELQNSMKPSVGWHEIGTATIRSVEHNQRICKAQATYRNIFDLRAVVHEKVYGAALGCCEEPSVGKIQQCFAKIRKHLQTL